jgi:phosphoglycerol transferase MdoB-like AlkP superfamily enzyme
VNGEMRELCGIRSTSIRLPDPQIPLQDCLPHRLVALGYRTTAIHGYRGSMFNRLNWYPLAGFEHTWFDRDLLDLLGHSSRCGSTFPGVCDGDIAGLIGRELDASPDARQFIYWMTLNAHLPIFATTDPRAAADCNASAVMRDDEQQCRLVKLHRLVMQALADMMASRRDTGLVIVGDHAPAFVSGERRHHLSPDHVPHAVIWPRDALPAAVPAPVAAP